MTSSRRTLDGRFSVASRIAAAVLGGYGLTYAVTAAMSLWLPLPRAQAALTASLAAFAFYVAAVIWAFAARTATRAWLGLLVPMLLSLGAIEAAGALPWLI